MCGVASPIRLSCPLFVLLVSSFVLFWCDLFIIILYIILSHERSGWETILCAKHKMLLRTFIWNERENKKAPSQAIVGMKAYTHCHTSQPLLYIYTHSHAFKHSNIHIHRFNINVICHIFSFFSDMVGWGDGQWKHGNTTTRHTE